MTTISLRVEEKIDRVLVSINDLATRFDVHCAHDMDKYRRLDDIVTIVKGNGRDGLEKEVATLKQDNLAAKKRDDRMTAAAIAVCLVVAGDFIVRLIQLAYHA